MNDHRRSLKKWVVAALIIIVVLAAWVVFINTYKDNKRRNEAGREASGTEEPDNGTAGTAQETKTLREFCADEELDAWFDSIEENTPVKMTYMIYGEAPIGMDFTERELILKAVAALQTVEIGGVSGENPDYVEDGGGYGYYFEMEDGTERYFTFPMGCFRWNGGEWHNVASYGTLMEVGDELEEIGNPDFVYIYAEDRGFYTEALETYKTEWKKEDGCGGGMFIYIGEPGEVPYIEVCRCETDAAPEEFLAGELDAYTQEEIAGSGASLTEPGKTEPYTVPRHDYPSMIYTAQLPGDQGGGTVLYKNVVKEETDYLLDETCLIRFCAAYREEDQEKVRTALSIAFSSFSFDYKAYEKKDVQPNNYLVDFINDDRLRKWFAKEDHLPDIFTDIEESWKEVNDPVKIRETLKALQTVKIGDLEKKSGQSGERHYFDFMYLESGESIMFKFEGDLFRWNDKTYKVLDWGDLKH